MPVISVRDPNAYRKTFSFFQKYESLLLSLCMEKDPTNWSWVGKLRATSEVNNLTFAAKEYLSRNDWESTIDKIRLSFIITNFTFYAQDEALVGVRQKFIRGRGIKPVLGQRLMRKGDPAALRIKYLYISVEDKDTVTCIVKLLKKGILEGFIPLHGEVPSWLPGLMLELDPEGQFVANPVSDQDSGLPLVIFA